MNISINGRHLTVRQDLRDLIEKKLAKFDRFFPGGADAAVTCRTERDDKIIEITINVGKTIFRAERADDTFQSALDGCLSSIERQIRKYKTKLEKRLRIGAFDKTILADSQWKDVEEEEIKIGRTKKFVIKPMTPEEAVLQMNLLGHEFFMFLNEENGAVSVVYKRKEDLYGVIEAEIE